MGDLRQFTQNSAFTQNLLSILNRKFTQISSLLSRNLVLHSPILIFLHLLSISITDQSVRVLQSQVSYSAISTFNSRNRSSIMRVLGFFKVSIRYFTLSLNLVSQLQLLKFDFNTWNWIPTLRIAITITTRKFSVEFDCNKIEFQLLDSHSQSQFNNHNCSWYVRMVHWNNTETTHVNSLKYSNDLCYHYS
jgi:hypothetical protein